MKKLYFLLIAILITSSIYAQTDAGVEVFINEIHYDNSGTDTGEGVEIAGPAGTNLSTFTLTSYNGNGGATTVSLPLSGIIPDEGSSGFGTIFFPMAGLQNGAPDGIALDDGINVQFLSYEGAFSAVDGPALGIMSTDIGVSESSSTLAGESLQLSGTGTIFANFIWNAAATSSYNLINPGQTFGAAVPTITITSPADFAVLPPGTTSIDINFIASNLGVGDQVDITVTKNAGIPTTTSNVLSSPFNIAGAADGDSYEVTAEIVNGGVIDFETIDFTIGTVTQVTDIAALIADVGVNGVGSKFYEITGPVLVTHTDGFNNRQWVQDSNISGILIFDSAGVITVTYAVGDSVTGLKGSTTTSNGILRFVPFVDSGVIASSGNAVTPQVVTIAAFNAAPDDYESELIRINNVTFDAGNGVVTFATGTNYNVSVGADIVVKRTDFFGADYIGQLVPTGQLPGIAGVAGEFNGTAQIYVRSLSDMALSTKENQIEGFNLYPNPTSNDFINISSKNSAAMKVTVFDVLGKQIINTLVSNKRLDVSMLNIGIYVMKVTQDNASVTKKLVIK